MNESDKDKTPRLVTPLHRLMGLETEYAIRFPDARAGGEGVTHRDIYHRVVRSLQRLLPVAPANFSRAGKEGVFLANGAAVWFERCRFRGEPGLIEGCTPECRSPRQLLICQRALDKLLSEAIDGESPFEAALLKNCRDANGMSYGAQENYEVVFATPRQRMVWIIGISLLLPLTVATLVLLILFMLVVWLLNALLIWPIHEFVRQRNPQADPRRLRNLFYPGACFAGGEFDAPYPLWMESAFVLLLRLLMMPIVVSISALICVTQFRKVQRKLLPFLISRIVVAGSGWLDQDGEFHLAEKAGSRRREFMHIWADADYPIYSLGNLFKDLAWFAFSPKTCQSLFRNRQRLQISIGDSNMCEEAEYLKIATTALVLDAIEAGKCEDVPQIRRPISALRMLNQDPTLRTRIQTSQGEMSALELQRWYFDVCRRYVEQLECEPTEAADVLRRWDEVLFYLERQPQALFGRIDWITKKMLLDDARRSDSFLARKKIDLKYHELSPDGYHCRLDAAQQVTRLADAGEIDRAARLAPPVNPAAIRSRYIREFSTPGNLEWVSWDVLKLGPPFGGKIIQLGEETEEPRQPSAPVQG